MSFGTYLFMIGIAILCASPVGAQEEPAALELSAGQRLVSSGDRAWYEGERAAAVAAYRGALETSDPSAIAMAHLRLLHFSGNLGMAFHGPRADQALAVCGASPWCRLAWADYHLFAPAEVGADSQQAIGLAEGALDSLPGPALARLFLATGDARFLERLGSEERDGLGDGLRHTGGAPPPGPGTWFLGVGLLGAPGLGIGGGLRWVHPDLAWRAIRLSVEASGTSRGIAHLSTSVLTPHRWHLYARAAAFREIIDLWQGDQTTSSLQYGGAMAAMAPGLRVGHLTGRLGAAVTGYRVQQTGQDTEQEQETGLGVGPWATLTLDHRQGWGITRRGTLVAAAVETALPPLGSDYRHCGVQADLRLFAGAPLGSVLGLRLLADAALLPEIPTYLLPTAGGAEVLRGAPAGRYRGELVLAGDAELRRMLSGPLEAVVFLDGAWVVEDGTGTPHPGAGLGLRLILPPRQLNVVRIDAAISDAGWALSTGWGEAF